MTESGESGELIKIRHAMGFTQREMAKLLKLSRSIIQKIEQGERPLTPRLVSLIHEISGCDLSASEGSTGAMVRATKNGDAYTREHFERHQETLRSQNWASPGRLEASQVALEMILHASADSGKMPQFFAEMNRAFKKVLSDEAVFKRCVENIRCQEWGLHEDDLPEIERLLRVDPIAAGFGVVRNRGAIQRAERLAVGSKEKKPGSKKKSPSRKSARNA